MARILSFELACGLARVIHGPSMEIRDAIHGTIDIEPNELPILDSRHFQRLRAIKQLGFAEYAYPGATHNRYTHSLGAMFTANQAFESIFRKKELLDPKTYHAYRAITRLAAMLHDIGHGPLSHTSEMAMPKVETLNLSKFVADEAFVKNRQATHEDYTLKILLDSSLTPILNRAGEGYGFGAAEVAALIFNQVSDEGGLDFFPSPALHCNKDFFFSGFDGSEKINFLPLLRQLISSELDADRMDYLRRDSFYTGVTYGDYDHHWLIRNLSYHLFKETKNDRTQQSLFLCIDHRALYAFEDFLISRFHMFLMVYFHHKSVIYDEMLKKYFETHFSEYPIPSDAESYLEFTDSHLMQTLSKSSNPWAMRITEKRPYRLLLETHSGLGELSLSPEERIRNLAHSDKAKSGHDLIHTTSTGQLSKYFGTSAIPIFVRYSDRFHPSEVVRLEQCTDLFERYREKRTIKRVYGP